MLSQEFPSPIPLSKVTQGVRGRACAPTVHVLSHTCLQSPQCSSCPLPSPEKGGPAWPDYVQRAPQGHSPVVVASTGTTQGMSVILPPPILPYPGPPACPCWDLGSVDPCRELAGVQKSEGTVLTHLLCLSGKPRASPGQTPHGPSAESLLCSRPCSAPLCLGCIQLSSQHRPAAPWDLVTVGSVSSPASCARSLLGLFSGSSLGWKHCPSSSLANSCLAFKSQLQPKSPLGPSPRTGVWGRATLLLPCTIIRS